MHGLAYPEDSVIRQFLRGTVGAGSKRDETTIGAFLYSALCAALTTKETVCFLSFFFGAVRIQSHLTEPETTVG